MKAEHRKELHTNLLADQLGKLVTKTKTSPKAIWLILAAIVLLGVVYWWWTTRAANRITVAWMNYWTARESPGISLVGDEAVGKGTTAALAFNLTRADDLYEKGSQSFTTKTRDKENLKLLDEAEKLYQEVAERAANSVDLGLRAALGMGKCEEAKGDLQRALFYYQEILDSFDKPTRAANGVKNPLVAEAEKRKERLGPQGQDAAFYKGWPERLPKSDTAPTK